jgi:hypothetical protein
MRRGFVAVLVLGLAACSQGAPSTGVSPSPSPSPVAATVPAASAPTPFSAKGPFAVVLHIGGVGEAYYVELVAADGVGGPFVTPESRSLKTYYFPQSYCQLGGCASAETAAYNLPEVSISSTRVYFLNGETQIRSLSPDGSQQTVMDVGAPPNSQVVFSVSPDDSRIAIAAITLATTNTAASFHDVMYVEDTGTAAHRVDIYSSTIKAEWPVAWRAGKLVVGVGPADIGSYDTPYGAIAYHVVDPNTGLRAAALDCVQGLLSPAGVACISGFCTGGTTCGPGTIGKQGYDGAKTTFDLPAGPPPRIFTAFQKGAGLSPDGQRIAVQGSPTDSSQTTGDTYLVSAGSANLLTHAGSPLGWIDDTHLVLGNGGQTYVIDASNPSNVLSVVSAANAPNGIYATVAGVLPTNLV